LAGLIILRQTEKLRSSLIYKKKVKFFNSFNEFMNWYNFIRPHGAFGIKKLETPAVIFYQRLPKKEVIMDPTLVKNISVIYVSLQLSGGVLRCALMCLS